MKGGGLLLLLVGGLVAGYLFLTGKIPGYGQGTPDVKTPNPGDLANKAGDAGQHGLDWFLATAWAPSALVAIVGGAVLIKFWQKIGGFGRAVLLIVGAVAVTIFVAGLKH